jgi:uncharacterized protein (TIGR02145 family)
MIWYIIKNQKLPSQVINRIAPLLFFLFLSVILAAQVKSPSSPPFPGNIELKVPVAYYIASVYDEDYLPYMLPSGPATTATVPADEILEAVTVDFQGTLTTKGTTVRVPYTVFTAPVNLPGYSVTVNVPETLAEDGLSRQVTFSYGAQVLGIGSGTFTAKVKSEVSNLNVKKLDINAGVGNDHLGLLLAGFPMVLNDNGDLDTFELRAISGIPDRYFGDGDHNFLYLPVTSSTGEVWLNNNLGADYSNVNHAHFNLAQQATSSTDYHAYGSLYQWGRLSDGHELINWKNSAAGTPVNGTSTLSTSEIPPNNFFILKTSSPYDWYTPRNDNLWQGAKSAHNPCPDGFRLPTESEWKTERLNWPSNNTAGALASLLRLTAAGRRYHVTGLSFFVGTDGNYWSSIIDGFFSRLLYFNSDGASMGSHARACGFSVRCIKD